MTERRATVSHSSASRTSAVCDPRTRLVHREGFLCAEFIRKSGGQGRNRTSDTVIFSHVLYQLSYLASRRRVSTSVRTSTITCRICCIDPSAGPSYSGESTFWPRSEHALRENFTHENLSTDRRARRLRMFQVFDGGRGSDDSGNNAASRRTERACGTKARSGTDSRRARARQRRRRHQSRS